ncbi:hypothetical protein J0H58_35215 [bacterium]|nr:hypothetical protein [bacterium]
MRRTTMAFGVAAAALLAAGHDSHAQRGRGGAIGGARGGSFGGGAVRGGTVAGPYGGGGTAARSGGTVVGPAGGVRSAGTASGSYTTNRGTTIDYAGAGRSATGPSGVTAGRGVGGVQVTTPGGREVTRVGTAGGIAGPGGNAIGGRTGVVTGSGPGGSFGSAYHGGVAVGPHGAVAGGTRAGVATGPGGTVGGVTRGGAAVGPYGAVAGRTTVARGTGGTYYASRATLATTGGVVRSNFGYYSAFTPAWYARYPGAWFAAGWTAARIWSAPVWGSVSSFCGYPAEPVYYDYGETVVYSGDQVIFNGTQEYPAADYYQGATQFAEAGRAAQADPKTDDFEPLGVFAMIGEGETKSTNIFQLAVNKAGVIRGNYYNALTDTTEPVYGSVDAKSRRAAWTVGDRKIQALATLHPAYLLRTPAAKNLAWLDLLQIRSKL